MGQDKERPEVADFIVEHAEKGGTVIYSRDKYGDGRPHDTIAAFTTPGEMLTWLAGQYGVKLTPQQAALAESISHPLTPGTPAYVRDIPEAAARAASQLMGVTLKHKFDPREVAIEPGFYWPTREALIASLEEALNKTRPHNGPFLPNAMLAATLVDAIDGTSK